MNKLTLLFVFSFITTLGFSVTPFPEFVDTIQSIPGAKNEGDKNSLTEISPQPNWTVLKKNNGKKSALITNYTPAILFATASYINESNNFIQNWIKMSDAQHKEKLSASFLLSTVTLEELRNSQAMTGSQLRPLTLAALNKVSSATNYTLDPKFLPNNPWVSAYTYYSELDNPSVNRYTLAVSVLNSAYAPHYPRLIAGEAQANILQGSYKQTLIETNKLSGIALTQVFAPKYDGIDLLTDEENTYVVQQILLLKAKDSDNKAVAIPHILARFGSTQLLKKYLELNPTEVDQKDASGVTPLFYAALTGKPETVQLLISLGAKVTTTDANENNVIHAGVSNPNPNVLIQLFSAMTKSERIKATTGKSNAGVTPIELLSPGKPPTTLGGINYNVLIDQMLLDGAPLENKFKYHASRFTAITALNENTSTNPNTPPSNPTTAPAPTRTTNPSKDIVNEQQSREEAQLLAADLSLLDPYTRERILKAFKETPEKFSPALKEKLEAYTKSTK